MKNLQINNPTIGAQEFPLVNKASEDIYIYREREKLIDFLPRVEISFGFNWGDEIQDMVFPNQKDTNKEYFTVDDLVPITVKTEDSKYSKELYCIDPNSGNYISSDEEDYLLYYPFIINIPNLTQNTLKIISDTEAEGYIDETLSFSSGVYHLECREFVDGKNKYRYYANSFWVNSINVSKSPDKTQIKVIFDKR